MLDKDDSLKISLQVELVNILSKIERIEANFKIILTSIILFWIMGILFIYYFMYRHFSKNDIIKKNKYVSDLKDNYDPIKLSYLMNKKINISDFVNYILYLIEDKKITLTIKDDDYILNKNKNINDEMFDKTIKYLFQNDNEISINQLKQNILNDYDLYIACYSNWYNSAINKCENENLYEKTFVVKFIGIIYSIAGIFIGAMLIKRSLYISSYFLIILGLLNLLFFILFYKRTYLGRQDHYYFKGLKNYLKNFSKWEELPKLNLWGKYLVFARSLKCYDSLSKGMIVRFNSVKTNKYSSSYIKEKIKIHNELINRLTKCIKLAYNAKKNDN